MGKFGIIGVDLLPKTSKMDFLGKLSRLSRSCLVVTKGKSCRFVQVWLWPFVTNGHERVKDNMYLSFLLFISVTANSTIPFFFRMFSNATAGIFSQTLWNHSLHWLHCVISYLLSFGRAYGTWHRQYNSTFEVAVSHLTTSPVIVGNGVSFPILRHSTRCGLIFFYHSSLSLDCYHTLDW